MYPKLALNFQINNSVCSRAEEIKEEGEGEEEEEERGEEERGDGRGEEEEDTYASVELVSTSRLRTREVMKMTQKENVEYTTIADLKQNAIPEDIYMNMNNE